MGIFGLNLPTVRNNHVVFEERWLDELLVVVDPGMTRESIERNLLAFLIEEGMPLAEDEKPSPQGIIDWRRRKEGKEPFPWDVLQPSADITLDEKMSRWDIEVALCRKLGLEDNAVLPPWAEINREILPRRTTDTASASPPQLSSLADRETYSASEGNNEDAGPCIHLLPHVGVGTRVEVYWPVDDEYYPGTVTHHFECIGEHSYRVLYDDMETETLDFFSETFRIIDGEQQTEATEFDESSSMAVSSPTAASRVDIRKPHSPG